MDSLGDLLTRIKNGYLARKKSVVSPVSKMRLAILAVLKKYGYINDYSLREDQVEVILKYKEGQPILTDVKRVSKPGLRVYSGWQNFPKVLSGYGICVVSTSKGVMSDRDAKKIKVGGEVICKVW